MTFFLHTVLAQLHAQEAVPELGRMMHESADPYIAAACAEALGRIDGTRDELLRVLNNGHSVIVRRAAEKALKHHRENA